MDYTPYLLGGALVLFIAFNWWSTRRRRAAEEKKRSTMLPGVEVMTNFGLYGTLISNDDVTKVAELQIAPKTVVKVHSSTLLKVVEAEDPTAPRSVEEAMAIANAEAEAKAEAKAAANATPGIELNTDNAIPVGEPQYGERIAEPKKPARRTAKKDAE